MTASPSSPIIAVVDDDSRTLESLRNLLESADYAVRPYSSAAALLEGRQVAEIDCLISDVGMPGMDGFELARAVHAVRPGLPIILITARAEMSASSPAPDSGNYRVFKKPFDAEELLAVVRDALRKPVS